MQIGKLDKIVTLQEKTEVNTSGSIANVWNNVEDIWCDIKTEKGSEAFQSGRLNARALLRIQMRFRPDIDTTHRLVWEGQIYNIIAVDRSHRRQGELWLTAQGVGVS